MSDDGGQAFPRASAMTGCPGMSLRDYFAAKALQGLLANPNVMGQSASQGWDLVNCTDQGLAHTCLQLADAMLAERAKGRQP